LQKKVSFRFLLETLLGKISLFQILLWVMFINTFIVRIIGRFILVLLLYNIGLYSIGMRRRKRNNKKFSVDNTIKSFIYYWSVYVLRHWSINETIDKLTELLVFVCIYLYIYEFILLEYLFRILEKRFLEKNLRWCEISRSLAASIAIMFPFIRLNLSDYDYRID
jgi:hypothetical protein